MPLSSGRRNWKYDFGKKTQELIAAVKLRKPHVAQNKNLGSWYRAACVHLVFPMFHELGEEAQKSFVRPGIWPIIEDIWNMFDNTLPVELLYRYMG